MGWYISDNNVLRKKIQSGRLICIFNAKISYCMKKEQKPIKENNIIYKDKDEQNWEHVEVIKDSNKIEIRY